VPKTAADLTAATWHYQVKIEMGGQQMSMKLATTIEDGGGTWTATDTMDTPQGSVTDTATIDKSSLILRKRSVKQGPVAIDVDFAGDKAAGRARLRWIWAGRCSETLREGIRRLRACRWRRGTARRSAISICSRRRFS
jgi:hypothetical protein